MISKLLINAGVLVVLFGISGCRFGNRMDTNQSEASEDPFSGYYETRPQTLKFYVTTQTTEGKSAPVSQIPTELTQYLTNPVAFILADPKTGLGGLTSPQGTQALPIFVDPDYSLSYQGTTRPITFWMDPNCQSTTEIYQQGSLKPSQKTSTLSGKTYSLSGSLELTIQVITDLSGNCTASLQAVADCYQSANNCGGADSDENLALRAEAVSILGPYLDSQAVTLSDVPNILNYAYEVSYQ